MSTVAIILAAGQGKRMGAAMNKQYLQLGDKTVLEHTLDAFERCDAIDEIVVVAKADEVVFCREQIVVAGGYQKISLVVAGGAQRQDSVYCGLLSLPPYCDKVVVHDGARPFIADWSIAQVVELVQPHVGIVVGVPCKDTIKRVNAQDEVIETPQRQFLWNVQTPQGFLREDIVRCYQMAMEEGFYGTDDASLMERYQGKVRMVMGSYQNIKLTTAEDMIIGEAFLKSLNE